MEKIKNKKIAFITPIYLPANLFGSGIFIKELAEEFAKKKHNVSIITSNALTIRFWHDPIFGKSIKQKYDVINNVKIFRLPCNQFISDICFVLTQYLGFLLPTRFKNKLKIFYSGPFLVGLKKFLQKKQFDIIHCSPFPMNINNQTLKICKNLKKKPKLIITPFCHFGVNGYKNPELKHLLESVDRIHSISNIEKNDICKIFHLDSKKVHTIPLFLKLTELNEQENLIENIRVFKKKYKLNNRKIILFAGNKGKMKGTIDVLHTVHQLYQKDPSYILITIGNTNPEWERQKKYIDNNCLIDFDYISCPEKEIIFGACDLFCMPSISESFGLVYLEAWHKKKPVIGADIPPVKELIGNANGGLLVKFGDINQLQQTIEKLIQDKNLSEELGKNGYKALISRYNLDANLNKYFDLFFS
ncbi:MAG: glycosyltransferase family 4 protein [Patescibacteria group bacterium]